MKQFPSIEKLDTYILYALELASSLSVLLLAYLCLDYVYGKRPHQRFCFNRQSYYATHLGLDAMYCH
jgi:hypothetical protein